MKHKGSSKRGSVNRRDLGNVVGFAFAMTVLAFVLVVAGLSIWGSGSLGAARQIRVAFNEAMQAFLGADAEALAASTTLTPDEARAAVGNDAQRETIASWTVTQIDVDGTEAVITYKYKTPEGEERTDIARAVKVDGRWRIEWDG